ncbi:nucleotidyltransferase domain-containing protein [Flavilitoribacter nigricans]|uniref:Polymerase nucleotidyl transferase domain-containing protein n=1 Tax=Flavilitoribacter nigricans (strain ATCC 23147 / DSM 23189 / NBRC 102662 / NCIMB 1420 / SS-2) TaxID=1122177 RepID=A0A2D0N461_FLAN2|nr:nucleotidyltransferase domain-containing protein [Flavilitoribacter nigricans]PHN02553.1 hypothetical protein CRP01_31755 [Flavilitoribacter nigricans DSM 23189 = NBRC 102662]
MKTLLEKYIEASQQYVEKEKLNKDAIGIVVSGSMKYATIDKNSDIDIYVILDPKCDYRERGNLWIHGIEVEYFKNPPAQIKRYFEQEKKSPHTAHMLAYGEVAYAASEIVNELVAMAKTIIGEKPQKLKDVEIEFEKYFIDDYYKDLEDALLNEDPLGVKTIRAKIINRSIDIFCKVNQIRRAKDKRLSKQIAHLDGDFHRIILEALSEDWDQERSLEKLRTKVEKLLGGRRTAEWKLRSGLDL